MSYILDALKKAEAQRRLGSVPDLHTQPEATRITVARPVWSRPVAWGFAAALLGGAAVVLWMAPRQSGQPVNAGSTASGQAGRHTEPANPGRQLAAAVVPSAGDQTPPAKPAPEQQDATRAAPADNQRKATQAVAEEPPQPRRQSAAAKEKKSEQEPAAAKEENSPAKKDTARTTVKKENSQPAIKKEIPQTTVAAPDKRLPRLHELPQNIRSEIPTLTIRGYIYSAVPAERSVLINDKLLHEGNEIAPGITLEKMLPEAAVVNYKGYRYRIPY